MKRFIYFLIIIVLFSCWDSDNEPIPQENHSSVKTNKPSHSILSPLSERTSWQKPDLVLGKLGDLHDKVIADIGAGTGYFSFLLLYHSAKVIAIEIDPDMITLMEAFKNTLPPDKKENIDIRLATPEDPRLEENEVDIALFVNVITYIDNRVEYLKNIKAKLKPDHILAIVDWKVRRLPVDAPPYSERVAMHIIEEELYTAGFKYVNIDDQTLDFQYIILAQ